MAPSTDDRSTHEIFKALADAAAELADLAGRLSSGETTVSEDREALSSRIKTVERLGRESFQAASTPSTATAAKARILEYLLSRVGQPVSRVELEQVAGITEWARRVRELRVEEGWPIRSLRQGRDYVLASEVAETDKARNWAELNDIRRSSMGVRDKLLRLFQLRVGQPVSRVEIMYVAGNKEFARRIRELDEIGWQILSERQMPTLYGGAYMLVSLDRDERPHRVPLARREEYLLAHRRCEICGVTAGEDGRWLEVDHRQPISAHQFSDADPNRDENLQTLCNKCHAGKTAAERRGP